MRAEPFSKWQVLEGILKAPLSQTQKLVAIALLVKSDKSYDNAYPGASLLACYASVKKRDTIFTAIRSLEDAGMIARTSRGRGYSNSYRIIPDRIMNAVLEAYYTAKQSSQTGRPDQNLVPLNGTPTRPVDRPAVVPMSRTESLVDPSLNPGRPREEISQPTKIEKPQTPYQSRDAWAKKLHAEHEDVFWKGSELIVLNGERQNLLAMLKSNDEALLTKVLIEVGGDVQGTSQIHLKGKVRGKVQRIGRLREQDAERDARRQEEWARNRGGRPATIRAAPSALDALPPTRDPVTIQQRFEAHLQSNAEAQATVRKTGRETFWGVFRDHQLRLADEAGV